MIEIHVNGDRLYPSEIQAGTAGSFHERLRFVFSSEWAGLLIKAVFYPVRGKPVEIQWFGNHIKIPPEVMRYSGIAKYVVSGYIITNGKVEEKIITVPGIIDVESTLRDEGGESIPQTPTVYEQLRNRMREDIADAIDDAVDANPDRFKGNAGAAATLSVVATATISPGNLARVEEAEGSTEQNRKYKFYIPRGATGVSGVVLLPDGVSIDEAEIPEDVNVVISPTGESLEILDGKGFRIIGFFSYVEQLDSVVPSPGDAYGIGIAAPYDIYVFDGNSNKFVNIGTMNGVKGDPGRGISSVQLKSGSGTNDSPYVFTVIYTDGTEEDLPVGIFNGSDGRGIVRVDVTNNSGIVGTQGTVDKYTIVFSDNTEYTFSVYNGKDGGGSGLDVTDLVEEGNVNAVSSGGVYSYIKSIIGDFETVAKTMDDLIGGTT